MILPFSGKLSAGAAHVCATMSQSLKAVAITFDSNILRTSRLCYKRQSQTSLLLAADRIKKITFFYSSPTKSCSESTAIYNKHPSV